jgi:hypothetical protein
LLFAIRAALRLDQNMDTELRAEMRRRIDSLAVNPLDASPTREMELARARFHLLENQAGNGAVARHVDQQRRAELAAFGRTHRSEVLHALLHNASFGLYTMRVKPGPDNLEVLARARRTETNLALLDSLTDSGTKPEVVFDVERIHTSVKELSSLVPSLHSPLVSAHAEATLTRLQQLTQDSAVQRECALALNRLNQGRHADPKNHGIAASIRAAAEAK